MIDTIITLDYKLERIGNRCLDEMGCDYLYQIESSKLINDIMSCKPWLKNITIADIKKYLEYFQNSTKKEIIRYYKKYKETNKNDWKIKAESKYKEYTDNLGGTMTIEEIINK